MGPAVRVQDGQVFPRTGVEERRRVRGCRVADEQADVHAPGPALEGRQEIRVGEVQGDRPHLDAMAIAQPGSRLLEGSAAARNEQEVQAPGRELFRERRAQAVTATGHESPGAVASAEPLRLHQAGSVMRWISLRSASWLGVGL